MLREFIRMFRSTVGIQIGRRGAIGCLQGPRQSKGHHPRCQLITKTDAGVKSFMHHIDESFIEGHVQLNIGIGQPKP